MDPHQYAKMQQQDQGDHLNHKEFITCPESTYVAIIMAMEYEVSKQFEWLEDLLPLDKKYLARCSDTSKESQLSMLLSEFKLPLRPLTPSGQWDQPRLWAFRQIASRVAFSQSEADGLN